MTKYFTQWDDETIGSNISGWTARAGGSPARAPAYGDQTVIAVKKRYLKYTTGAAATIYPLTQDLLDADSGRATFSIVTAFAMSLFTAERLYIFARGQGNATLTDQYQLRITPGSNTLNIDKEVASVYTFGIGTASYTFTAGHAYYIRFEGNGTALKVRVWDAELGAAGEPTTWNISITDSGVAAAGWIGLSAYHGTSNNVIAPFNFFAVGTNGDSAVAPRTNTEYNTWLDKQDVQRCVLAEMSAVAYDATDATDYAGTKTFYSSNIGFTSASQDSPATTFYDAIISKIPTFSREMSLALSGKAGVGFGAISITNPRTTGVPENHLLLGGALGGYASTPDSAANSITGDIEIRAQAALSDWTPAATSTLVGKYNNGSNNVSYVFDVNASGLLRLVWSPDGTAASSKTATSTVATGIVDGGRAWVKATLDVDNGAAGYTVKFYKSIDGVIYTQLGATVTVAGVTSIFNSTIPLEVGSLIGGTANILTGKIYRAEVYNGIGGTLVASFNPSVTVPGATSFNSTDTGELWTMNGTAKIAQTEYIVGGVRDDWLRMKWKKDYIKLYLGDATWPKHDFRLVLLGRLDGPVSDGAAAMSFAISDLLDKLDRPFQTNVIGGTTGNANKYKPFLIGALGGFIDPVSIDAVMLKYQVHDGAVESIGGVYDNYVSLSSTGTVSAVNAATNTLTTAVAHGMVAGYTLKGKSGGAGLPAPLALETWYHVIAAGLTSVDFRLSLTAGGAEIDITGATTGATLEIIGWIDNGDGTFTLAAAPAPGGRIIVDGPQQPTYPGANAVTNVETAIFTKYALSLNFKDQSSFDTLKSLFVTQYVADHFYHGMWVGTEKKAAIEVLKELCEGFNGWYGMTPDGLLQVGQLGLPAASAAMSFTADDIKLGTLRLKSRILPLDFTQCNLYYSHSYLSAGSLQSSSSTFAEKRAVPRLSAPAYSTPIDTAGQGDTEMPRDYETGAAFDPFPITEQTRLKTLYAKQIGVFEFQTRLSATRLSIGETISLTHEREGWKQWGGSDPASPDNTATIDSRLAVVIGIDTDLSSNSPFPVKLTVFRHIPQYAYQIA